MKTIISILILFGHATAFADALPWNKPDIDQMRNAKTYKELLCPPANSKAGQELCDLYREDLGRKPAFKIEMRNESTVIISSGGLSAKVERTQNSGEFLVNGVSLFIASFEDQHGLAEAIQNAVHINSASWPTLLDRADAAETFGKGVDAAVQRLMVITTSKKFCEAVQTLVKKCVDDEEKILAYIKTSTDNSHSGSAPENIENKLIALKVKLDGINEAMVRNYGSAKSCYCDQHRGSQECAEGTTLRSTPVTATLAKCDYMMVEIRKGTDTVNFSKKMAAETFSEIYAKINDYKAGKIPDPNDETTK